MNGADLDLPLASRAELDLQRRLARCRRHYVGNALQARLDIAQAAPDVDLELSLAFNQQQDSGQRSRQRRYLHEEWQAE